jgi:hypothetical protein
MAELLPRFTGGEAGQPGYTNPSLNFTQNTLAETDCQPLFAANNRKDLLRCNHLIAN